MPSLHDLAASFATLTADLHGDRWYDLTIRGLLMAVCLCLGAPAIVELVYALRDGQRARAGLLLGGIVLLTRAAALLVVG